MSLLLKNFIVSYKKTLVMVCILLNFFSFIYAETKTTYKSEVSTTKNVLRLPVYYVLTSYLSTLTHEGAHALVGTMFGYKVDNFNVALDEGEVTFKETGNMDLRWDITLLAGPASNRITAVYINKYLNKNEYGISESQRSFFGMLYLMNRLYFSLYIWQTWAGAVLPGVTPFNSDWSEIGHNMAGENEDIYYSALTVFFVLDLWDIFKTRQQIVRNWNRMLGKYPVQNDNEEVLAMDIDFSLTKKGFMVSKKWKF